MDIDGDDGGCNATTLGDMEKSCGGLMAIK